MRGDANQGGPGCLTGVASRSEARTRLSPSRFNNKGLISTQGKMRGSWDRPGLKVFGLGWLQPP